MTGRMPMDSQPKPSSATETTSLDCRTVGRAIAALEHASKHESEKSAGAIRAHFEQCSSCATRHGTRLRQVEGLGALRDRSLPEETFDGFYAGVRERMPYAPPSGGMSAAFLDAPRTLRLWRRVAVAAGFLLVLGGAFAFSGGLQDEAPPAEERPLHDPRERLLQAFDAVPASLQVRPLEPPRTRGHGAFFDNDPGRRPERVQAVGHGTVRPVDAGWK